MPIYVYQCQSCHAVEEHIQGMSDDPVTTCAVCGGPLQRSLTSAAFHLKGGGWYKDGYASSNTPAGGGAADKGGSSTSDSGSSGGDSKSASTSAS